MQARSLAGSTLGYYELAEALSLNEFSSVYRAVRRHDGKELALKLLALPRDGPDVLVPELESTVAGLRVLRHPSILPCYDLNASGSWAWFSMPLMRRGSLRSALDSRRVEPEGAWRMLAKVAYTLDQAHEGGIVHGNLHPSNVLFDGAGGPVLADFGPAGHGHVGRYGLAVSSLGYLGPEQLAGRPADRRTDVYALAVLVFEILTGFLPFVASTPNELALAISHQEPIPASMCNPALPPALDRVLLRALSKDPGRRPQTALDLMDDLFDLAGGRAAGPNGLARSAALGAQALPPPVPRPRYVTPRFPAPRSAPTTPYYSAPEAPDPLGSPANWEGSGSPAPLYPRQDSPAAPMSVPQYPPAAPPQPSTQAYAPAAAPSYDGSSQYPATSLYGPPAQYASTPPAEYDPTPQPSPAPQYEATGPYQPAQQYPPTPSPDPTPQYEPAPLYPVSPPAPPPRYDPARYQTGPQYEAAPAPPQYEPAPSYPPSPQYDPAPQVGPPQYEAAAPYQSTPQYEAAPQYPATPQYEPTPRDPAPQYQPSPAQDSTPQYQPASPPGPMPRYQPAPQYEPGPRPEPSSQYGLTAGYDPTPQASPTTQYDAAEQLPPAPQYAEQQYELQAPRGAIRLADFLSPAPASQLVQSLEAAGYPRLRPTRRTLLNSYFASSLQTAKEVAGRRWAHIMQVAGLSDFIFQQPPDDGSHTVPVEFASLMNAAFEMVFLPEAREKLRDWGTYTTLNQLELRSGASKRTVRMMPVGHRMATILGSFTKFLDSVRGEQLHRWREMDNGEHWVIHYGNLYALGRRTEEPACHIWVASYEALLIWAGLANEWVVGELECGCITGSFDCVFSIRPRGGRGPASSILTRSRA